MLRPNYRALLCWCCLYWSPESSGVLPQHRVTPVFEASLVSTPVVHTHRTATCRHTRTRIPVVSRGTSHRWHGQTWKAPRYLKIEQSTDVQLTPDTFRKLAPHPLPACSTQATFQCLLLYLSLELQYYCEASGRLLLLMPPKHTVGRSLLLRQHHCKQFKCERSLHCHHFPSVIRKSFHLSSDDNCRYLLTAITCL